MREITAKLVMTLNILLYGGWALSALLLGIGGGLLVWALREIKKLEDL